MRWRVGARWRVVLLSFGAGTTRLRNAVWADPVALWREAVDLAPAHYRPRLLLGEALQDAGRRDEAIEQYRTAIRLRPGGSDWLREARAVPRRDRAVGRRRGEHFLKAIDVDPRNALRAATR